MSECRRGEGAAGRGRLGEGLAGSGRVGGVAARVRLAPGEEEDLRLGRRWFYRTEVAAVEGAPAPGAVVDVLSHRGRFVARGFYNPRSMLAVRVLTEDPDEAVDAGFFRRRITAAWGYRRQVLREDTAACRVVFGEADFLPGLVVDKFGEVLALQTVSLGIDLWKEAVADALTDLLRPAAIYERNDVPVRELEGLDQRTGLLRGSLPAKVVINENGVLFNVDVAGGQKTGHFLDQRFNRAALRPFVAGQRVLDAFTHDGGFGLHAACYGAAEVVAVDVSEAAIEAARANARLNGVEDRMRFITANAFELLRRMVRDGERFDVVILDPPAFAKSRSAAGPAFRGYKEINLRAMRLLPPGGILCTSSCSHHLGEDLFLQAVREAALDARRLLRVIERRTAAPDHPVLLGVDETYYLKCFILQVL